MLNEKSLSTVATEQTTAKDNDIENLPSVAHTPPLSKEKLSSITKLTRDEPLSVLRDELLNIGVDKKKARNVVINEAVYRTKSYFMDSLISDACKPFAFGIIRRAYIIHLKLNKTDYDAAYASTSYAWRELGTIPTPKTWDGEYDSLLRWQSTWLFGSSNRNYVSKWVGLFREWRNKNTPRNKIEIGHVMECADWENVLDVKGKDAIEKSLSNILGCDKNDNHIETDIARNKRLIIEKNKMLKELSEKMLTDAEKKIWEEG